MPSWVDRPRSLFRSNAGTILGVMQELCTVELNPMVCWYGPMLRYRTGFYQPLDMHCLLVDTTWPSRNPSWRFSAGPTPVPQGHPPHYSSWTSSTTSTPPTFSFPCQHPHALHPRDLTPLQPDVHQCHPPSTPTLPPHLGFGLPQTEPQVPALTLATQM